MKYWLSDAAVGCSIEIHRKMGASWGFTHNMGYALIEVEGNLPTVEGMQQAGEKVGMKLPIRVKSESFISPHRLVDDDGNILQVFPVPAP